MKLKKLLAGIFTVAALILVMSLSAFAEDYEAQIGKTGYATLKEALQGADTDDTVKLLKDVEINEDDVSLYSDLNAYTYAVITKGITIDFNSHTVKYSDAFKAKADSSKYYMMFCFNATGEPNKCITITGNGTINSYLAENVDSGIFFLGWDYWYFTIENGSFNSCGRVLYSNGWTNRITVNGGSFGLHEGCAKNLRWNSILNSKYNPKNITMNSGSFYGIDPREVEDIVVNADNYAVEKKGNVYTVIPASSVVATITRTVTNHNEYPYKQEMTYSYKSIEDAIAEQERADEVIVVKEEKASEISAMLPQNYVLRQNDSVYTVVNTLSELSGTFATTTDCGYYSETKEATDRIYKAVFNTCFDGNSADYDDCFFGMFIYKSGKNSGLDIRANEYKSVTDGKYNAIIDNIDDENAVLIAIPYIYNDSLIVKTGDAATITVKDAVKWLGELSAE